MVLDGCGLSPWPGGLSVLALSSRFDGRVNHVVHHVQRSPFSTRSVESF